MRNSLSALELLPRALEARPGESARGVELVVSLARVLVATAPPEGAAPGAVEYRAMSSSVFQSGGCFHLLVRPETQPALVVRNLLPDEGLDFRVDSDPPFPASLGPNGGSAQYSWRGVEGEAQSHTSASAATTHTIRFRRVPDGTGTGAAPIAEPPGWSAVVRVAEGVQVLGPLLVHIFYRSGSLVVLVGCEMSLSPGLEALKRYAFRPSSFDLSLVLPSFTFTIVDDSRPLVAAGGLNYSELLQVHGRGAVLRMVEQPPDPRREAGGSWAFGADTAHVRYSTTYSLLLGDLQVDSRVRNCDIPVALWFKASKPRLSFFGVSKDPPCLTAALEMISLHRPEVLLDRCLEPPRLSNEGPMLPYVRAVRLAVHRKLIVAAEEPLLKATSAIASRFAEAAASTPPTAAAPLPPAPPAPLAAVPALDAAVDSWRREELRPRLYLGILSVSEVRISSTLRLVVPGSGVYLGLDRTPLLFSPISLRRLFSSPSAITAEVMSSYAADALLRSPQLLGSLQLLGNPTSLVSALALGVRDLVVLPLEAIPYGPLATSRACFKGATSFLRHVSGGEESPSPHTHNCPITLTTALTCTSTLYYSRLTGALASVSGFSSSVSRNLTLQTAKMTTTAGGDEADEHGRVRRLLGSVGRGLVLAPIVGAMSLVGRGAGALSRTVGSLSPFFQLPPWRL